MKKRIKICIDARPVLSQQTGLGRYIYNLVKSLLEIDHENQYVILIRKSLDARHPINFLEQKNLRKKFSDIPEVSLQQQFLVPLELRSIDLDVYHYPNFDLPILQPINSVFTVHDLTYLKHRSLYMGRRFLKNVYTRTIMALGTLKAKKIISVSESTKHDLIETFKVPSHKVHIIPEAVDESYFSGASLNGNAKNLAQAPNQDKYFLFVGQRRPHKNIVRIIEAFDIFKKRYPSNLKLIIAGKPYSNFNEPEKKAKELNQNDVLFLGYVDDEALPRWFINAEALVFTSIYEGFGIPLLEAMACGTPIITSNLSSMPEVAGDAALTVDPYNVEEIANAMQRLIQDKVLRKQLIANGFRRVKNFTWQSTAEKTLELYEGISKN